MISIYIFKRNDTSLFFERLPAATRNPRGMLIKRVIANISIDISIPSESIPSSFSRYP